MNPISHGEKARIIADIYLLHKKLWPETEDAKIINEASQIAQDIFGRGAEQSKLETLKKFEDREQYVFDAVKALHCFIEEAKGILVYDKSQIRELVNNAEAAIYKIYGTGKT